MSDADTRRSPGFSFSLGHLLAFTALTAVLLAVGLAYKKNRMLNQQLDALLSLSSRLRIRDKDSLASSAMPAVADDFHSWQVYVPEDTVYELHLGIGAVSKKGIPPTVGSVRMTPGEHRVTFHTGDSSSEEFRYVVYVDGIQVIEKTMGSIWIPGGWGSASSIDWPQEPKLSPSPLQLAAQSYEPRFDFGSSQNFNGQSDEYVTHLGYRLWIDQSDRSYKPESPFIGFPEDTQYLGVGLRDGLRFCSTLSLPYQWTFKRPKLASLDAVFHLEAEFFTDDGMVLSSQSPSFQSWQIHNAVDGQAPIQLQEDPLQTSLTAYLHATSKSEDGLKPVIEILWDASKPDEVGLRLADAPANKQITRWRLRILGGSHHLWRELRINDRPWITPEDAIKGSSTINASDSTNTDKVVNEDLANASKRTAILDLGEGAAESVHLQWQTNEKLPLQIVEQTRSSHAGMGLYKGLPVSLGIQIPADMKPIPGVDIVDQHPSFPGTIIPGGPVFDELHIDLNAVEHEWIRLSAKRKE